MQGSIQDLDGGLTHPGVVPGRPGYRCTDTEWSGTGSGKSNSPGIKSGSLCEEQEQRLS